jgi:hypothetical protein
MIEREQENARRLIKRKGADARVFAPMSGPSFSDHWSGAGPRQAGFAAVHP